VARTAKVAVIPYFGQGPMPAGSGVFYLCIECRCVMPSIPPEPTKCGCGNVSVDPDGGRGGVKDASKLIVLDAHC
jgi:hypothetical protein